MLPADGTGGAPQQSGEPLVGEATVHRGTRTGPEERGARPPGGPEVPAGADWSWPPAAPVAGGAAAEFHTEQWAPPSSVRRPWLRIGRWILLYRRTG